MNKKTNYMEKLPPEVTLEIFCRLPPESVVQCKLVCKSWLSLLHGDDPNYFANMHLRRHLEYPTTLNFIALYKEGMYEHDQAKKESVVSIKFHITEYDEEKSSYKMVKTINFSQCTRGWLCVRARLAGSCNGLLCFTRGDRRDHCSIDWDVRIGICNPLLNEYVHLPVSDLQVQYGSRTNDIVVGFGHNPSPLTDEYKVVSVYYSHSAACYNNIGDVEVYTVGTSMWRRIGTIKYKLHVSSQPVLVNGLLHWLSQDRKQKLYDENGQVVVEHHQLIVSFDFETEEFQVISLPHDEDDDDFPKMIEWGLKELRRCLCLITQSEAKELMDIWVLKDYMNKESWVKEFSINLKGREPRYWYSFCPIIKKKKNGDGDDEILYLWRYSKRLFTYDPKTLYIEEVEGSDDQAWLITAWNKYHDPVLHINNSLVSLKGLGENARMYREILLPPFNNSCRWRGMHNY